MGQTLGLCLSKKDTENINFEQLALDIKSAKYVIALTGAGVSVESGIPTFRDPADGLWERYDPATYATIWGFWRHPEKIWELLRDFCREYDPLPNDGHKALYRLEQMGKMKAIITQASCYRCGAQVELSKALLENSQFTRNLPPVCSCGGVYKPDAVLFGEGIPSKAVKESKEEVEKCDLMLIIGTSATVSPASDLPYRAMKKGAKVVEVNIETTPLTNRVSDKIVLGK